MTVDDIMALAASCYSRIDPEPQWKLRQAIEHALLQAHKEGFDAALLPGSVPDAQPVAWIQPDHLQKARVAPFLCRVEPTKRMADFIPIYTQQVTHGLQVECHASATDDSRSSDGLGAGRVDWAWAGWQAATLAERERAAKVCEDNGMYMLAIEVRGTK